MELSSTATALSNSSRPELSDSSRRDTVLTSSAVAGQQLASSDAVAPTTSTSSGTGVVTQVVAGPEAATALYEKIGQPSSAEDQLDNSRRKAQIEQRIDQIEQKITSDLAQRDREVRAHEQAHAAVGGAHAGSPSYSYTKGPDGRLYATEGSVQIDTAPVEGDPQATLEKAEQVARAALAVSEPSPADRQVAAQAQAMANEARAELAKEGAGEELRTEETEASDREQLEEQRAEQEQRRERDRELAEQVSERNQQAIETLRDFNVKLSEIQETWQKVNLQLEKAGIFSNTLPPGELIDQNV